MITLFLISLIIFLAGIAAIVLHYGIPSSISESYYLLPQKWRLAAFYAWMLAVALPLMICWLDISEGTFQAPVFFGCILLVFIGVAAPFRDNVQVRNVHVVCTVACVLFTQTWIAIYTPFWLFSIVFALLAVPIGLKTRGISGDMHRSALVFFLELAAFMSVYVAVWGYGHAHGIC
jgi:hypothetical protein